MRRLVVPFGADGAADRAARAWAAPCRDLVIENHPGEGGLLGVRRANELARSGEPVLLLGTPTTHVLLPARCGEGPDESFSPVAFLGSVPNVLLVSPRLGVRSVAALIELARGMRLTYASAGYGQTIHVCAALFCSQAGVRMTHKAYEAGSATAYRDLASGAVQVYFDSALACDGAIARGDAVALAVSSAARTPRLAQTPTLAECGFPEHALDVWLGIFGHGLEGMFPMRDERLARELEQSAPRWRAALAVAMREGAA